MAEPFGYHLYSVVSRGPKMLGTYDPEEILPVFEEELTFAELDKVVPFLRWLHETGKGMGFGNYEERYAEYLAEQGVK